MIKELLPPSIKTDVGVQKLAEAGDRVLPLLFTQTTQEILYARIEELQEKVLDLIAWQLHIEGYELAKNLQEKVRLIKAAIEVHRIKGTLAGVKLAHELSKTKPLRILTPHHRTFLSLSLTDQDRKSFLRLFPELRLVKYAYRGFRRVMKFIGHIHPYFSDAPARYGIRAYLKKGSELIPLRTVERQQARREKGALSFVRVAIGAKALGHFFRIKDRFLLNQEANKRLYTLRVEKTYEDEEVRREVRVAYPSMETISVLQEEVAERGQRYKKTAFVDYLHGHTTDTEAERRLYKRLYLYDPEIAIGLRRAFSFLNAQPISIPAYNAEVKSQVREKVWNFYKFPGKTEKSKLRALIRLLSEFKSLRDKMLLDTVTKRVVTANGQITAGMNINAGGLINA